MSLTINGIAVADLSLAMVAGISGWTEGPTMTRPTQAMPGLFGVAASSLATAPMRQIRVPFVLTCTSLTDRETKLAAVYDALTGLMTLSFADHPTRCIRAICGGVTVAGHVEGLEFVEFSLSVVVTFIALDALSYDIEPKILSFTTTPLPVAVGTAPTPGLFLITGSLSALSTRTITYRSINGIAYGAFAITPPTGESLGTNDFLEVSTLTRTLTKVTSVGVRSSVYHWKSAGTWNGIVPEPADCDRPRNVFPTLEIDSGAASYIYRPAWIL